MLAAMKIQFTLLAALVSALQLGCQAPEPAAAPQPEPAPAVEAVQAATQLPEVRYYMIADT